MPVRYRRLFWLATLFIAISSTTVALVSLRSKTDRKSANESQDAASSAAQTFSPRSTKGLFPTALKPTQASNNTRLEAELITLHPTGFEPAEITRPAGPFILAFQNRSGLEQLMLRIDKSSGPRMREVQIHWERSDWNDIVELPVGSYTVTEANNPDWGLRLTITPR
jgi:hypothetical protein